MGGSIWTGRHLPVAPPADTWRLAVCSSNPLFQSAVRALQSRVQWQLPTPQSLLKLVSRQPIRSLVLLASDDGLEAGLMELLPALREQLQPAQLKVVLFVEDAIDPVRLQALLALGGLVICRLQLFHGALLSQAINTALLNRPWVDPLFTRIQQGGAKRGACRRDVLPSRERELLRQVGQGYNALEISQRLGIRSDTVRRTLSRAYRRIGVRDRAQAVGWCLCHGLISRRELEQRYRPHVATEELG